MTACFPASKSAIIFNFVSKVLNPVGLLAFLTDCINMGTDFIPKINKQIKEERNHQCIAALLKN
jgi:hypothetical protein